MNIWTPNEIIRELFAGDKAAPEKHAGELLRRLRKGQEAVQLLSQPLPARGRGGDSRQDLVFCGKVNAFG
jgi:hypothetical protein